MRPDIRGYLLSLWLTLGITTLTTTLAFNYFTNTGGFAPATLRQSTGIILGMWGAALLCGLVVPLLGWPRNPADAIPTALLGVLTGLSLRLIFLKTFLPNAGNAWTFLRDMVLLDSLPAYPTFMLLSIGGSIVLTLLGVLTGASLVRTLETQYADDPRLARIAGITPPPRVLGAVMVLGPLFLLNLILFNNLDTTAVTDTFTLQQTVWVTLPGVHALLAAGLGLLIGASFLCPDGFTAGVTVFLGLIAHVTIALLLDSPLATYDPLYAGLNYNQVAFLPFIIFWFGTPLIGGVSAFAYHLLRELLQPPDDFMPDGVEDGEAEASPAV